MNVKKGVLKRFSESAFLITSAFLLIWMGRLSVQYELHRDLPPIHSGEEINQGVPTVTISGIEHAQIRGEVSDMQIRVVSGDQVAIPEEDLSFALDIQHLGYLGDKRPVVIHEVPEWARYVASKSGKYFYEITTKSAKNLSVPNRVYFADETSAEEAGYLKR